MLNRVKIVYYVNGSVKTDILVGTDPTVQRRGKGVEVMFPHGDGRFEVTGNKSNEGDGGVGFVNYRVCDKFTRLSLAATAEVS